MSKRVMFGAVNKKGELVRRCFEDGGEFYNGYILTDFPYEVYVERFRGQTVARVEVKLKEEGNGKKKR